MTAAELEAELMDRGLPFEATMAALVVRRVCQTGLGPICRN
jgi:hypothetical protein